MDFLRISIIFISILTFFAIKLLIFYAPSIGLIDFPNERSSHKKATPQGAGLAIFLIIFIYGLFAVDLSLLTPHWIFLLALTLVFLLGVYDDLKDTAANYKFYIIIFSSLLMFIYGFKVDNLGTYFGHIFNLPPVLSLLITVLSIVGLTNAINLTDGLDGLAALISLIILSSLWFIGYKNNDYFLITTTLVAISVICVFLFFNWNPAQIFLGDSGSLTIGFLIGILCIKSLSYISPVAALYIVALPIFDTIIVMIKRKYNGKSMFLADKKHMHHILLRYFKGDVKKTVLLLASVQLIYSFIGLFITVNLGQEIMVFSFLINLIIFYLYMQYLDINN